jgi:hypothetical protein
MTPSRYIKWLSALVTPNPARQWLLILGLSAALFAGLFIWAGSVFYSIKSGSAYLVAAPPIGKTIRITHAEVQNVFDTYQTRSLNYAAGNISVPKVYDPAPPASLSAGIKQ